MKRILLLSLGAFLLSACGRHEGDGLVPDINLGTEKIKEATRDHVEMDATQTIPGSHSVMIPLSLNAGLERSLKNPESYLSSGDDDAYSRNGSWYDILFYNPSSAGSHLLLMDTSKMILNYRLSNDSSLHLIFYEMATADINNDKQHNFEDPVQLYASDADGNHLTALTPAGAHCDYWTYLANSRIVLAYVHYDSDNNHRFNHQDESDVLRISVDSLGIGSSIINSGEKAYLKDKLRLSIH